jgi:hypothetical protein
MIVSRGALQAAATVARVDGEAVVVRDDGSIVASNRFTAIVTEPLPTEQRGRVPLEEKALGIPAAHIPPDIVSGVARGIARDRRFGGLLEHAELRADAGEDTNLHVETTNGVQRTRATIQRTPREGDGEAVVREILSVKSLARVVVNRKRLVAALEALEAAAPDATGESPTWLEIDCEGGAILLRAIDYRTGARSAVRVQAYRSEAGKWLERDEWETVKGDEARRGCIKRKGGPV